MKRSKLEQRFRIHSHETAGFATAASPRANAMNNFKRKTFFETKEISRKMATQNAEREKHDRKMVTNFTSNDDCGRRADQVVIIDWVLAIRCAFDDLSHGKLLTSKPTPQRLAYA